MSDHRCRLCTTNDTDALIEKLAEDLWISRMDSAGEDVLWAKAGAFWQERFRALAVAAVASLRGT